MAPRKKRRRRSDGIATRKRIIREATRMFAAGGYEATSLRQISAAADIDIATLKYHFGDKANLFAKVYEKGHMSFLEAVMPIMEQMEEASTRAEVRDAIEVLVVQMHDFVADHLDFVKLTLFRLLEEAVDTIGVEDDLQTIALAALEQKFQGLIDRGVIQPIDARALVAFLISSFSMWQVTARVKANWVGEPHINTPEGRARSERYLITAIERILGVGGDPDTEKQA